MKFELIICRKSLDSSFEVLEEFGAENIDGVVWQFESDDEFLEVYKSLFSSVDAFFRFILIGLDGTENNPIPNLVKTNDPTIEYYLSALEGKGAEVRYAIRVGSELHYSNRERLLRKKESEVSLPEGQS